MVIRMIKLLSYSWSERKNVLIVALLMGFIVNSLFIFMVFIQIWLFGFSRAVEPNKWILYFELVFSGSIFFGSIYFGKKYINEMVKPNINKDILESKGVTN